MHLFPGYPTSRLHNVIRTHILNEKGAQARVQSEEGSLHLFRGLMFLPMLLGEGDSKMPRNGKEGL